MEDKQREMYASNILTKIMSLATTMNMDPEGTSSSGEKYKLSFIGKENETFFTNILSKEDAREYELAEGREPRMSAKYHFRCDCNKTEEGTSVEIRLTPQVDVRPAGKILVRRKNKIFASTTEIDAKEEYVSHYELSIKIGSNTRAPISFKTDVQEERALVVLRHVKKHFIRIMKNREKYDLDLNNKAFEKLVHI